MESRIFGLAKQTVEYVSHFVEKCDNIVMAHEGWFIGSWLGQVGDHGGQRIAALPIGMVVAGQ